MGREIKQVVGSLTAANDATPTHTPGDYYQDISAGVTYQYVRFDNGTANVVSAAGLPAYVFTLATFVVTTDMSAGLTTKANGCVGVFQGVVTDQYYTWIIVRGPTTIATDGGDDFAIDDTVIGKDDSVFDRIATGAAITAKPIAYATAADDDSANTCAVHVIVGPM